MLILLVGAVNKSVSIYFLSLMSSRTLNEKWGYVLHNMATDVTWCHSFVTISHVPRSKPDITRPTL